MLPAHSSSPAAALKPVQIFMPMQLIQRLAWEHPGLERPQTHLQYPVEMENFQTFTKAWNALAGEEDLGQLVNSPKTPTAALIISS